MRYFSARETEWLQELDGIELAGFWRRAFAFVIDWILVIIIISLVASLSIFAWLGVRRLEGKPMPASIHFQIGDNAKNEKQILEIEEQGEKGQPKPAHELRNEVAHIIVDIFIPVLYFGVLLWKGKGRTPAKRLMKIRVISIVHRHLSFWHCVERALGYGAAALEAGFGFIQFFIHPYRRCAQDRLAETIVVTESSYQALQHRLSHPLVPDGAADQPDPLLDQQPAT